MSESYNFPGSIKVLEKTDAKKALYIIIGVSLAALTFLVWLIYFKAPSSTDMPWVANLSALNATFNTFSTVFLLLGFREIKRRNFAKHMNYMISAFVTSSLFLVSYIVYHTFHGDSIFHGEGIVRPIYFFILVSHIILSALVVPLILSTFYFSLSGKFKTHRKIAKWAFPIWLYVSVTGVLVFVFLKVFG